MRGLVGCLLLILVGVLPLLAGTPSNDADHAWQEILQQAFGPGTRFHNQEEALAAARQHLDTQESSLRAFVRLYPDDPRAFSARIRLSGVLEAKSRVLHRPALESDAQKLLSDIESGPGVPPSVKADAGFARVSHSMEAVSGRPIDDTARDGLLKTVRQFDADYPDDRRTAGLLTEVATLYDAQPAQKKALLEEAMGRAKDETLRNRISDDLKRLTLLGRPLDARLLPLQGGAVNLSDERGRVVVILFWATWSVPSLRELARLKDVETEMKGQPVEFVCIALDEDRTALTAAVKAADLRWPVHYDGRGWKGELVRSLGINALPTVWVLDRRGVLVTLNAHDQVEDLIHAALDAK